MSEHGKPSAAKRQQIIRGAELAFTESGYEGASMSRIAFEAGVSKGTLYNYFDNKSSLFAEFVEQKAASTLARIFQTVEEEEDTTTALNAIALRMLEMIISAENLVLYRIVLSEARKFPQLAEVYWQSGPSRAIAYMTEWVSRQVLNGKLHACDPGFAAEQFLALCQTRVALRRRLQIPGQDDQSEIDEVVGGAVRLFLAGYGVEPLAPTGSAS